MQARLWLSGRCFECCIERIESAADGWIVKTRARRYFRFDAASIQLLDRLMRMEAPDLDAPEHASDARFVERRLIPVGIYRAIDEASAALEERSTSTGTMRWQRQLLTSRQVRPMAAALAPLFSPWLLWPVLTLCLWLHAGYILNSTTQIGYHDLLTLSPNELLLLVGVALVRGLLHELGHAAACWRLTRSVGPIGFGIFMATPVLYCDVSDIHLLPRKAKAWVGMAGTAMDVAFLALLISVGGADLGVLKVYWLSLLAVLLNLVPFYRNDGYWVINDLAGSDDLLKESVRAFASRKPRWRDAAMLGFTASCVIAVLALGGAFALELGPCQVAEAVSLLPSFPGVMLAGVTTLQYTSLVFGALGAAKALRQVASAS